MTMENTYTVNVRFVVVEEFREILKNNKDLDDIISDKERNDVDNYDVEKTKLAIASESNDPLIDMEVFLIVGENNKVTYTSISRAVSALYPILLVSYSFSDENVIIKGDINEAIELNPKMREEAIKKIFEITFASKSFILAI